MRDIYGNTPLGVALQKNHFNYGIILIQKNADVTVDVHYEYPKRLAKMWKDEEKKQKAAALTLARGADVSMDQDDEAGDGSKKKHRNLFNPKS